MGFSVSGSFAIIVVASIVAFGMFHSATSNKTELVSEARQADADDRLARQNAEITITNVSYKGNKLRIHVNNTGATTLHVNATDVIIDGKYRSRPFEKENVNNDQDTDLWEPGEELFIRIRDQSKPKRLKVVTDHGIADTKVI